MSEEIKRNCNSCRYGLPLSNCKTLNNNESYSELSQKRENDNFFDRDLRKHEFKDNYICSNYKSRYIEYPIEVSKINKPDNKNTGFRSNEIGRLVKISPCSEEYKKKTYLGFYLGDLPIGLYISHNSDSKELNLKYDTNPAIFIPELRKIIYGMESYWEFIENEEDFKPITDDEISNVWYIKLLKEMCKTNEAKDLTE